MQILLMNLFYSPHIKGDTHQLEESESKHAIRVLRLMKGDQVILVDGLGGWHEAYIEEDHPKRCVLRITRRIANYQALDYSLHLAVSPTKNMERMEWFLEKATEIGISEVTPLLCHRTERKQVKMDRLERILVSAMKQSLKAFKPVLHPPVSFEEFVLGAHKGSLGIAYCKGEDRQGLENLEGAGPFTFLVGPEGDFTKEEVELALSKGFKSFHLGESRLRTETAAVYITAAISILHQKKKQ
jgi:16S rRNA (uracil1498-N3)-methyltransferase